MIEELKLEHYKNLKEEYRQYLFQVQQLWVYKLSTLGVVITAAIFNDKITNIVDSKSVVLAGLFALPLLAFLIDLKALEVGIHAKVISDHIKQNYKNVNEIFDWESNLWSKKRLSRIRSALTILAAVGPSIVILIMSFIVIYGIKQDWITYLVTAAIVLILIVIIIAIWIIPKLLR